MARWIGNSSFCYAKAVQDSPLTIAGLTDADMMWDRIDYFLERDVPVAGEN